MFHSNLSSKTNAADLSSQNLSAKGYFIVIMIKIMIKIIIIIILGLTKKVTEQVSKFG